ncbi:MAG: dynamin [Epsilonproteobacteria bacterium]|nr:dynamin [Campylobacterota bacterium]
MSLFTKFISTYKKEYLVEKPKFDESLLGLLKKARYLLLDDRLSPSISLKNALDRLKIRVKEPMKVAITGQFSSGKSTFLNALMAKNILPTGITPVTSKVNYIRYGDELKIRVKYKDGRDEYHDIEHISKFIDQRKGVEDIDYLILYSPLNMLKDIVFVDTPGLNSLASTDTQTTIKVLNEVDGIIWLTLMDNAGKMSEEKVLQKYLSIYKNKSLCVLNQKDKFSEDEIKESVTYVKESFGEYFSEVVPISAKQALKSRSSDKLALMSEALDEFTKSLHSKLANNLQANNLSVVQDAYKDYDLKLKEITNTNLSENIKLAKISNISKVIDFIKEEIQPKAVESKEYSIKKEINSVCVKIINQYELFLKIYDELKDEIEDFDVTSQKEFVKVKKEFSQDLKNSYISIKQIIEVIATEIYNQIHTTKRQRYTKEKRNFLQKNEKYDKIVYEAPFIDADEAYKKLFYEDNLVGKMFKKYSKTLNEIENRVNETNAKIYQQFEENIYRWQSPYSIIRKKEDIQSDIEFANIRKFAARVYEHILKPYNDEMLKSRAHVSSGFEHISSAIEFNYQNATGICISFLNEKMEEFAKLYEQNPIRFSLYHPTLEEIKQRLDESFFVYKLEKLMDKSRTFLNVDYDRILETFKDIKKDKLDFIDKAKNRHEKIINLLKELDV